MSNPITELLDLLHQEGLEKELQEVKTALKMTVESIDNIKQDVDNKAIDLIKQGDRDKAQALLQIPDKVKECSNYINDLLEDKPLDLSSNKTSKAFVNIDEKLLEKHSLFDISTKTKPYYYTLDDKRYDLERYNWKYFLYGLIDTLWNKDRKAFDRFRNGIEIKNPPNLSFFNANVKDAHRIANSSIYVRFYSNASEAINYAKMLLDEYNIDPNRFFIYWINRKNEDNDDEDSGG